MTTSRLRIFVNSCLLVAAASACSQGPVTIGDNQPTQLKTGLAAYAANWDGYVEAYQFVDGSDRVRITIKDDGTGTIRFGTGELWPQATDPNAKYPPSYPAYANTHPQTDIPTVWDRFNYTLNNIRIESERIRGNSWSKEIFGDWCRLQTPNASAPGSLNPPYICLPSCNVYVPGLPQDLTAATDTCYTYDPCPAVYIDITAANVPFLCERFDVCNSSCNCDASGCKQTNPLGEEDIVLDGALDTEQSNMTGTLVINGTNYAIRLKRQ